MTEGETMSDNRFSYCLTADEVLDEYLRVAADVRAAFCRMDANPATRADAVARIAELTRTVTAEQRRRVGEIVSGWVDAASAPIQWEWPRMQCHAVADRIIDALGYQAEPAHDNDDDQCKPSCHCQPDPPAPVVELDADQLRNIANILDAAMSMPSYSLSAQCYGGSITRQHGRWVLRIGGDQ